MNYFLIFLVESRLKIQIRESDLQNSKQKLNLNFENTAYIHTKYFLGDITFYFYISRDTMWWESEIVGFFSWFL